MLAPTAIYEVKIKPDHEDEFFMRVRVCGAVPQFWPARLGAFKCPIAQFR